VITSARSGLMLIGRRNIFAEWVAAAHARPTPQDSCRLTVGECTPRTPIWA
jgi:hypothetical protein